MKKIISALSIATAAFSINAQAQDAAGAQFSFLNGYNAPNTTTVKGIRLSIFHGKSGDVSGADFSLLGMSEVDNLNGVHIPLFIGANRVHNSMTGAAFGLFNWHEGQDVGANIAFVNMTNNVKGANLGAVNIAKGNTMADISVVNLSASSNFQLGIFNKTDAIKGVQIGLINCADNGFLPCFPFVNFAK
ncbi:hypothetical protein SIN8267_02063 [Sinobacterium norvegicum]|uniref:PhaC PHA synthase n=1 Tax=Sinobacterium norvegicum TaxID=1641715 RepID=A0ABN8EHT7_9GAMM|nr:hypothetical protein [Sinobacterium norvegicum]CAH0991948.1 hypothetical protein SIN8267_02063 [Sinobacterium norvegicum]